MLRPSLMVALGGLLLTDAMILGSAVAAQQPVRQAPLAVGETAPDFTIPGATRYGVLRDSVRLSDFRGKTLVLAFFFRARTRG